MAPYFGLLDRKKCEIRGKGYGRLDISNIAFAVSPPRNPQHDLVFVNAKLVKWPPAKGPWPTACFMALYEEIDSPEPTHIKRLRHPLHPSRRGDTINMAPGALAFEHRLLGKRKP